MMEPKPALGIVPPTGGIFNAAVVGNPDQRDRLRRLRRDCDVSQAGRGRTVGPNLVCCRPSTVRELLQGRAKAQAAVTNERRAENLGLVIGKGAGKPAGGFLPRK